ncbi:EF-Tu/IF-2/RF-3 family GTPase [Kribbella karoonensis]|uniref:Translation elongation factor EFTu-like domain-containing protein n=1 Tax=Kribbella karoonensis TaxID=324851 RepID=A0ABP4PDK7_9ACTN
MGWKFWKRSNPMDPQELLARGHAQPNSFPERPQDSLPVGSFGLTVEDVFSITGRGTVVTGQVRTGTVSVGDQVMLSRAGQPLLQVEVTGVEMFRKIVQTAKAGDNVGLLLRGIKRDQVARGDVLSK